MNDRVIFALLMFINAAVAATNATTPGWMVVETISALIAKNRPGDPNDGCTPGFTVVAM